MSLQELKNEVRATLTKISAALQRMQRSFNEGDYDEAKSEIGGILDGIAPLAEKIEKAKTAKLAENEKAGAPI